jgi:hypothetical protein
LCSSYLPLGVPQQCEVGVTISTIILMSKRVRLGVEEVEEGEPEFEGI